MARVGLLCRIAGWSAATALMLVFSIVAYAEPESPPLDGRVVFPSEANPHPPPPDLNPPNRGQMPVATQGRAGDPLKRNDLEAHAEAAAPPERVVHSRPTVQQGRVGAPGSLPTPEEVDSGTYRGTSQPFGAGPKSRYIRRPVVQMGRVGDPAARPPGGVVPESSASDTEPRGTQYHARPAVQQGRVAAMYDPHAVAARREAAPVGPPAYVPRPLAQEGRVGAPGSLQSSSAKSTQSSVSSLYVPRPPQQQGRVALLQKMPPAAPPTAPSASPATPKRQYHETGRVALTSTALTPTPVTHATGYVPRPPDQQGRAASLTTPVPAAGPSGAPTSTGATASTSAKAAASPQGRVGAPQPPPSVTQGQTPARNTNLGRVPAPVPAGPNPAAQPQPSGAPTVSAKPSASPTGRAQFNTPAPAQPGTSAAQRPSAAPGTTGAARGGNPGKASGAPAPAP